MSLFCDLHNHSTFSDGTDTPTALVALAEERGLGAIALTDHNTVAGAFPGDHGFVGRLPLPQGKK